MPSTLKSREVIVELDEISVNAKSTEELMNAIIAKLNVSMLKYNWIGFYMLEQSPSEDPVLVLGPYVGAMTPHTRIPLNQGICGAAASSGETVIVDDVNNDPRYLACSIETKSEIVVPIYVAGKVLGELDIDSHFNAAFGPDDREICEYAAKLVGNYIEKRGR